jgi:hypothetical protein
MKNLTLVATALLTAILLAPRPARAIVVCDDPSAHLIDPTGPLAAVGYLNSGTSATLVNQQFIVTAKHALSGPGRTFRLDLPGGAETHEVVQVAHHPTLDLAVGTLAEAASIQGARLYTGAEGDGMAVLVAGYGVSGAGAPDSATYPKGTGRFGYNAVRASGEKLIMKFDSPTSPYTLGADAEAMPADGDSGGGSFVLDGDQLYLVGVHYAVADMNWDFDGLLPEYGDLAYDVRISAASAWIESQMHLPEPTTLALLAIGSALLARRRRGA